MPKTSEIDTHFPRISRTELRRFDDAVTIRDPKAFIEELTRWGRELLASAERIETPDVSAKTMQTLKKKAAALKTDTAWQPSVADLQKGRIALLDAFSQPSNLPVAQFAKFANKSRQQVYKDIEAGRLLTLQIGNGRQRVPDWQLDPVRLQLTQTVLARSGDVDTWTLFDVLTTPSDGLRGASPLGAVGKNNVDVVARVVLATLGIHRQEVPIDHT